MGHKLKYAPLSILLACATPAAAEVYQWVDSEGRTHFGDRAASSSQAGGVAKKIEVDESATRPDPEAQRNREHLRMLHRQYDEQRQADAQRSEEQQQKQQQLQQRCRNLQDRMRDEQNVAVMFRYDDAGKRVLWTAEERTAYRDQMAALNRQYCSE